MSVAYVVVTLDEELLSSFYRLLLTTFTPPRLQNSVRCPAWTETEALFYFPSFQLFRVMLMSVDDANSLFFVSPGFLGFFFPSFLSCRPCALYIRFLFFPD